jgi:hypothetical protein
MLRAVPIEDGNIYPLLEGEVNGNMQSSDGPSEQEDTLHNVIIYGNLTQSEMDDIRELLMNNRRCFSPIKGKTHLTQPEAHLFALSSFCG